MWSRERVVTGWAQLWNLPNMLTLLRILMIPFFWYLLMYDDGENAATRVAATVVFVLAAITDWLDGWLARKQGLVTTFGKIADPLADKALTGVALIGLSVLDELWWWVTILIISREVGVTVIRFVVLKHGVIPASRGGKAKTLFQMVGITLFLLPITPDDDAAAGGSATWSWRSPCILTALTGFDYISKAYWTRSDSKSDKAARKAAAAAPRSGAAATSVGRPAAATGRRGRSAAAGPSRDATTSRVGVGRAADLIADLIADGATVATAESITGGRLVAALTSVPGSSAVVRGAVVAYADRREDLDARCGSGGARRSRGRCRADVAEQMARGVRDRLGATYGVATTGEAGPDSGQRHGRSGRCSSPSPARGGPRRRRLDASGDREQVQQAAVEGALRLLAEVAGCRAPCGGRVDRRCGLGNNGD